MDNNSVSDDSRTSLPCFSLDEQILQILWDEGVQMEDLLEFSFERIGKLAADRGVEMDDERKIELWQYVSRMRAEEPEWLSLDQAPKDTSTLYGSFWDMSVCLSPPSPGNKTERQTPYTSTIAGSSSDSEFVSDSMLGNCSQLAAWDRPSQTDASGRLRTTRPFRISRCSLSPISPAAGPGRKGLKSRIVAFLKVLIGSRYRSRRRFTRGASTSCAPSTPLEQRGAPGRFRSMRNRLPTFVRRSLRGNCRRPHLF